RLHPRSPRRRAPRSWSTRPPRGSRSRCWSQTVPHSLRDLRELGDLARLRLLRGVRVLRAGVDLELLRLRAAELVLRQHALDDLLDQHLGLGVEQLAEGTLAQTAGVTAVPVGELLLALVTGERDLLGVDDDDEVTG